MVGRVDADARIGVLVPGAADIVVLLENDEGNAHLLKADRRTQTRKSRTDDDDRHVRSRWVFIVLSPSDGPGVLRRHPHFFGEKRNIFGWYVLADGRAHQMPQPVRRRTRRCASGRRIVLQNFDEGIARAGFHTIGNAFVEAPRARDVRRGFVQQSRIAGELCVHDERRNNISLVERMPKGGFIGDGILKLSGHGGLRGIARRVAHRVVAGPLMLPHGYDAQVN